MRRKFIWLFLLGTMILLIGCGEQEKDPGTYERPPELYVNINGERTETKKGTYSWSYDIGGGASRDISACTDHPLNWKDSMEVIQTTDTTVTLEFEGLPGEIQSAACWSDANWGNTQAVSEEIDISDGKLTLKEGGYIYEIYVQWNQVDGHNGNVYYYFYSDSAK